MGATPEEKPKKVFKIVSIIEVPPENPLEATEPEYLVLVQLWDGRPFSLRVKKSELKEEVIKKKLKEALGAIEALQGKILALE